MQADLDKLSLEIEEAIAFDATLTNDAKRKAAKSQLMSDEKYQSALSALQVEKDHRSRLEIQTEMTQNQFTVEKLGQRMRIADLEVQAA